MTEEAFTPSDEYNQPSRTAQRRARRKKTAAYIKRHHESSRDRKRRRRAVIKRDGERCRWCGMGPEDGVELTLDHIVPISKGGGHEIANRQLMCLPCNQRKGDRVTPMMRAFAGESA